MALISSTYITINRVPYEDFKIKSDESFLTTKETKADKIDKKTIKTSPRGVF